MRKTLYSVPLAVATLCVALGSHGNPARAQRAASEPKSATTRAPLGDEQVTGDKPLALQDALGLALQNNRDLQAARVRLTGAHADVERAMAALLPTLSAQGRMTINDPVVSVSIDSSGSLFGSVLQGAQLADLQLTTMTQGMPGPATTAILNTYCNDPNRSVPDGVKRVCQQVKNPLSFNIDEALNSANLRADIVPRLQIDGILALNMPLIVPAAYPALKGAKTSYRAQEAQLKVTEAQVLSTVAVAYYAAAGTEELLLARRHAIEVAQKTLDNEKIRLAAGVINRVAVTRAELAAIQAEQRLREAIDARASAYRTLATLLGQPAGSFKVVPGQQASVEQPAQETLVEHALSARPELLSLRLSRDALGSQVTSQWLRYSPTLSLFGNVRLTNATGFAGRVDSASIGLQLDWLIFDGFARDAQRHAFFAQKRDAELRLSQLRDTISDEVISGRRTVETRKQGLVTADRSVGMARDTLELVRSQYQAGTATQLDLLSAQDTLIQTEVGLAQARFDLSLSVLNLKRLTGDSLQ